MAVKALSIHFRNRNGGIIGNAGLENLKECGMAHLVADAEVRIGDCVLGTIRPNGGGWELYRNGEGTFNVQQRIVSCPESAAREAAFCWLEDLARRKSVEEEVLSAVRA